ncbi:hypothetical protein Syn7502_03396 [Synechococcus sp. PCC 7502]|nr:hypothetical protein Syn7502_03396 [Synechococcus sp. PCC 7502]
MIHTESYRGQMIMVIQTFRAWECFICYATYQWVQAKHMFEDSNYAIAYAKRQIDILLSKSLNIQP